MYSLPVRRLKEILSHVVPNANLGPVEEISSTQLPRLYQLNMSDDRKLLLSFAPSLMIRLLRQEAAIISSEATLVHFIAGTERNLERAVSPCSGIDTPGSETLSNLIPKILKSSSNNRELAYPYTISEPTGGVPLSTLSVYLSIPERREIDKQIGSMARALASLTSPTGTFGTVGRVLPDPYGKNIGPQTALPSPPVGCKKWSEAFNLLLEGILRDGEDVLVLLPYAIIRAHCRRLSWHLDAVTIPRLVVLDVSSERNVMVERGGEDCASYSGKEIKMTGLRSWSLGAFGDPLIADAFDKPSEGFLEGWNGGGESVVEDEKNAGIRLLLYRVFSAAVSIVTEHYRPQIDSSRKELDGRRKLTSVLAELEKVDLIPCDVLKRGRRPSGEEMVESLKKAKLKE
ncbi:hypothetical protein HYFRA_00005795 [Hymenoscyphus fraxineus]|uniref:Uncharacterized protein n=1 Tax=Hymenoscyphus fraxineus TaxID=746836 RepID=A0A9N9KTW6_9HELO|nr:hypothetical protein HYFRA_00005795 [Hymenoscyphus fraxineus]